MSSILGNFFMLNTLEWEWAVDSAVQYSLLCIWQSSCFPAFDALSCIFFGHGWMASVLHPLIWSSARGFLLVLPRLFSSCSCVSLWLSINCFRLYIFFFFPILPSLLFSSLPYLFAFFHFFIPCYWLSQLHFLYTRRAPVPPWQTYPITRTITVKAKLWIKGMISPQWPMPWRGWVPLRLCQHCPAVQDPSPACTTASCSAQAARRPSRGWRWSLFNRRWHSVILLHVDTAADSQVVCGYDSLTPDRLAVFCHQISWKDPEQQQIICLTWILCANRGGMGQTGGIVGNGQCSCSLKNGSVQFLTWLNSI